MTATASSAFALEDRASPALRGIREEAKRTTLALHGTAAELDKIGSPSQQQRLERFKGKMDSVATRAEGMSGRVKRSVGDMEDAVARSTMEATGHLLSLEDGLRTVGQMKATPRVNLQGYAEISAQIASIDRQLDVLSRKSATPRVNLAGAGGAAAGAASSGGGSSSGGGVGKGFSFLSNNPLAAAAIVGAPLLGGAIPPILGSAAGAGLGAGALGIAGIGTLGVGIAGIVAVVKPAEKSVKALSAAEKAYTTQVQLHGAASKQAQLAQAKLNLAIAAAPAGSTKFLHEVTALRKTWGQATKPGQGSLFGMAGTVVGDVRAAAPFLGRQANLVSASVGSQGSKFGGFLTSPQELHVIEVLAHAFANDLGGAERTAEHLLGTLGNIAVASTPFFHQAVEFVDRWTGGWERSTSDITATRRTIGGYLNDLKAWGRLGGAGFNLIKDLVMPGRVQGTSVVGDLTRQLNTWDEWLKLNPDRLRLFFQHGIDGTKSLARLLGTVAHDLTQIAQLILPVLSRMADLANLAGGAGLLIPTAIRLGLGKSLGGRSSSSGAAGAAGGGMVFLGGRGSGGGATAAGLGGMSAATTTSYLAASSLLYGRRIGPYSPAGAGALAGPEGFAAKYGGVAGAHYAMPVSELGAAPGRFAAAGSSALSGARTVGRFAAPIFAISAATSAATTQGNLAERIQAAASGLTFGILGAPVTGAQAGARGRDRANTYIQGLNTPQSAGGFAQQIAALTARQRAAAAGSRSTRTAGAFGYESVRASLFGESGPTVVQAKANAAATLQYAAAIRTLRQEQRDYQRQASQQHGDALAQSFEQAFGILSPSKGPAAALRETLAGVVKDVGKLKPEGAKALTEASIAWARSIAQGNPKLQGIVREMTHGIQARFSSMGKHIEIVNGQVLTGSTTEWKSIAAALITPAEQARQEVSKSFTAIQQEAVGSLQAMGYSPADARKLLSGMQSGSITSSQAAVLTAPTGQPGLSLGASAANQTKAHYHARGGRLHGKGLQDTVAMGDGGWGAPGELILNRHTEADADRDLRAMGRPTLDQRVRGETRRHSDPMRAKGGRLEQRAQAFLGPLWDAARGFYPGAGTQMPKSRWGATSGAGGAFVGMLSDPSGSRRGRYVNWPRWTEQDMASTDPRRRGAMAETAIHEWAHFFQKPSVVKRGDWETEGGAQAFTRQIAPFLFRKLGLPYSVSSRRDDTYLAEASKVHARLGNDWIRGGQFRARGGRTGGFSAAPGTNYSVGSEPTLAARLNALGHALGINLTGISGYRSPAHSVAVGGFANDPHTGGNASDTPGVEGVSGATLAKYGLVRPFGGAAEADHIQLLGSIAGGGAPGVGGGAAGGIIGATLRALRAPRSRLRGVPGALSSRAGQAYAAGLTGLINRGLGGAAGGAGGGVGQISSVGGILAIARAAAAAEGVPWNASIVSTLLSKESGGGKNLAPHNFGGILDPAGPFQVISSTFAANAVRGHGDRMNPVDNALAAMHYIKGRYGSLEQLAATTGLLGGGYKGYSQGGRVPWYGNGGSGTVRRPTLIGIGDHPRGENFKVAPVKLGPPSKRAGTGAGGHLASASGLGSVIIQHMAITNNRAGDIKKQVKDEVGAAFAELAYELDHGVNADEEALIR